MLLTVAPLIPLCRSETALSSAEADLQLLYKAFARNGDAYDTFVELLPVRIILLIHCASQSRSHLTYMMFCCAAWH